MDQMSLRVLSLSHPEAGIGLGLGRLRLDRVGWMARYKGQGETLFRREELGSNLCMCHLNGGENRPVGNEGERGRARQAKGGAE